MCTDPLHKNAGKRGDVHYETVYQMHIVGGKTNG